VACFSGRPVYRGADRVFQSGSDLYLYFARDDGIYLNTLANPGGGTKLVNVVAFEGEMVFDIE
jgi:hypothetical protein